MFALIRRILSVSLRVAMRFGSGSTGAERGSFARVGTLFVGFLNLEVWKRRGAPRPILVVRTTDSCSGLAFDRANRLVYLVRQDRAPMVRDDNPDGTIVELAAGRFDRSMSPKALFAAEASEEIGVRVREEDVDLLNDGKPLAASPGVLTERCYLAIAEITGSCLEQGDQFGVAAEHEVTTRIAVSVDDFLRGPHDDLRVYTLARELEARLLRER